MPEFSQAERAGILAFGGNARNHRFSVFANSEAGITGGNSAIGGHHTKGDVLSLDNVDNESHFLVVDRDDPVLPYELTTQDALEIRVFGVGENGADLDYVVSAFEELGNGFVRLRLLPKPTSAIGISVAGYTGTPLPLSLNTRSSGYEITLTGMSGAEVSILGVEGGTADIVGTNLYITPTATSGFVYLVADLEAEQVELKVNFEVA